MKPIDEAIAAFAERSPPRLRYLVGVSGGRDSVALLDLLDRAGFKNLVVCHLNHGLRGRESGQDAAFVRRLAKRNYRLPFDGEKVDVARFASAAGISIEEAGRRARLSFFARASKKWRCRRVILAHHGDDQVETVLMNLGRGTATGGLRGMRPETVFRANPEVGSEMSKATSPSSSSRARQRKSKTVPLTLLRPLLGVPRRDLDSYMSEMNLPFREDPSNSDLSHLRNRIRHQLIPNMKKIFGRDIRNSILRSVTVCGDEDKYLDALASEALANSTAPAPGFGITSSGPILEPTLKTAPVEKLPTALQRRVLHLWLGELGIPDTGFKEVESVRALLPTKAKTAKVNLPRNYHVRRKSGHLFSVSPHFSKPKAG